MSLTNLIDIATDEKQTEDDWTKILHVCKCGTSNPKECLKLILKKIFNRNPHVALRSLILLDACVQNIGPSFTKEICSRYFVSEIKSKSKSMHRKVLPRLCYMIKIWSEEFSGADFDPFSFINELNKWLHDTFPNLYATGDEELNSRNSGKSARKVVVEQEEADIAKAIALSLKETETKRSTLYPSTVNTVTPVDTTSQKKPSIKVRALYDFEAAEENELTFKAGEIIIDVDTSNEHWWTGSNHRGVGMFPAQFVTVDLDGHVDSYSELTNKANDRSTSQTNHLSESTYLARPQTPVIDESRIDDCIRLIEDADPTGEMRPDPAELAKCEAQCRLMGPLIDQELEKVDRHYNRLVEINAKIIDSFQMYNELMTQGGMIRPTGYMYQPHATPAKYMNMHHDPSSSGMPHLPGINHPMMHAMPQQQQQQQQQQMDAMRFQSMNYYNGADGMQNQQLHQSHIASSSVQHSIPSATYPLPPHMSLDKDQHTMPPTHTNHNNATLPEVSAQSPFTVPTEASSTVTNHHIPNITTYPALNNSHHFTYTYPPNARVVDHNGSLDH